MDSGELFDGGLGYGWDAPLESRERGRVVPQILDTFVFTDSIRTWELALPNGYYEIWLAVGDAQYPQGPHLVVIDDVTAIPGQTTAGGDFLEIKTGAQVTDGFLTVAIGGASVISQSSA